jgi:erythromycin esterase-like protein
MWRNHETWRFVAWLRNFNAQCREPGGQAGFYGLDLYSLFTSIRLVLEYLGQL